MQLHSKSQLTLKYSCVCVPEAFATMQRVQKAENHGVGSFRCVPCVCELLRGYPFRVA